LFPINHYTHSLDLTEEAVTRTIKNDKLIVGIIKMLMLLLILNNGEEFALGA
jgi:hypothetical protein